LQGREEGQTFPLNWILKNREKQEKQGKRFRTVEKTVAFFEDSRRFQRLKFSNNATNFQP
jgi:hypothetical protein